MKKIIRNETDREIFLSIVKNIKIDSNWVGEIKKQRKIRTISQNRLYWLWLKAITMQTDYGYEDNWWHEYYKNKFLPKVDFLDTKISLSTKSLDTKQFTDYLDKIRADAIVEHGAELLTLNDKNFNEFYSNYM